MATDIDTTSVRIHLIDTDEARTRQFDFLDAYPDPFGGWIPQMEHDQVLVQLWPSVPVDLGLRPRRDRSPARRHPGGMVTCDLNADLGESFGRWVLGDDAGLLEVVTSANVACGFHAGDPTTLRATCVAAAKRGVAIGAQVGYRDLAGFGRRFIDVERADLEADVLYQLGALDGLARVAGSRVRYVKPHGALYNATVTHEAQATAVVAAVVAYDPTLPLLGLPGSALLRAATAAGLQAVPEAFADRAYTDDGHLVPRREPGAVLHDPALIARRATRMITGHEVESVTGRVVPVHARSVCVHGDTPGAVEVARAVRDALVAAGVELARFAAAG